MVANEHAHLSLVGFVRQRGRHPSEEENHPMGKRQRGWGRLSSCYGGVTHSWRRTVT